MHYRRSRPRPLPPMLAAIGICLAHASCGGGNTTTMLEDAGPALVADARPMLDARDPEQGPLPILGIDTSGRAIPEDEKITARFWAVEDHDGTLTGLDQRPRSIDRAIGVEIRGNTSASFAKKSYGFEVRDDLGQAINVSLLGMPPESDWVLHGPYSDKTLMRNKLAYELGRAMGMASGRYQPRSRLVELFLGAEYQGVYLLVEKIKRDRNRVAIPVVAATAAAGDITGGYIIKREGSGEDNGGWTSSLGTPWDYHYPNQRHITAEQAEYIQGHVDAFEAMMSGPLFSDPAAGYPAWIDIDSFVDYAILTELSRNVDGYRKSAYMYKVPDSQGGRFYMGPLWDFNLAFGNADYCGGYDVVGFQFEASACPDLSEIPVWWQRLMANARFTTALRCRWNQLRGSVLASRSLADRIARYRGWLAHAEPRDHGYWGTIGVYVWPNPFIGDSYDEEVDYMESFIERRIEWLDANLPGVCQP